MISFRSYRLARILRDSYKNLIHRSLKNVLKSLGNSCWLFSCSAETYAMYWKMIKLSSNEGQHEYCNAWEIFALAQLHNTKNSAIENWIDS